MVKHIFVTGGVSSALGKGITAASLGRLLKARGLKVTMQKLDPYLNVDPGTMNPFEHGEVFVTDDGGETDLDLGHYERFIDESLHRGCSVSSGQVWLSVISKERRGDYLGKTVQVIPHITDEIKHRIQAVAEVDDRSGERVDVVITEVGGTVGDIEGLPFLEAIRQLRYDVGRSNICYVHCALVPYISAAGELKTKPAQHSVRELRSIGIQPDVLVLRSDRELDTGLRRKVAMQCDVDLEAVIAAVDQDSLYAVPLAMREEGLDRVVATRLGLPEVEPDLASWESMVARVRSPREQVTIAVVGKYVELPDAYLSVAEALRHGGLAHGVDVQVRWVSSDDLCPVPGSAVLGAPGLGAPGLGAPGLGAPGLGAPGLGAPGLGAPGLGAPGRGGAQPGRTGAVASGPTATSGEGGPRTARSPGELARDDHARADLDQRLERWLGGADGILVPGGFGIRGVEGKIAAIRWARERQVPFLGLCLGLQSAVIEFARNVVGLPYAHSAEFEPDTPDPVIDLMHDQRDVTDKGGTMRLGEYAAKLRPGTRTRAAYGDCEVVYERHRHRYEVNNRYREQLESAGLCFSGLSPNDRLVEFIELPDHPWFVATQAHPELKSRPNRPHPLFAGFIGAAERRRDETSGRLPVDLDEPGRLAPAVVGAREPGTAVHPHDRG